MARSMVILTAQLLHNPTKKGLRCLHFSLAERFLFQTETRNLAAPSRILLNNKNDFL
jgi:hypothetical protein